MPAPRRPSLMIRLYLLPSAVASSQYMRRLHPAETLENVSQRVALRGSRVSRWLTYCVLPANPFSVDASRSPSAATLVPLALCGIGLGCGTGTHSLRPLYRRARMPSAASP